MTTSFALKVLFEIGLVLLIAYGYINEEKLIAFEQELFAVLKFAFKKYVLKSTGKNKANKNKAKAPGRTVEKPVCTVGGYIPVKCAEQRVSRHGAVIKDFPAAVRHTDNVA